MSTPEPDRPRISLRDIAGELGISHVSVSKALRGLPGVSDAMRARIQEKAEQMGYVPDPLLSALSNYRKKHAGRIQSELAWINAWPHPEELREHNEFNQYWEGASKTAERMGYRLEAFNTADISLPRLQSIFTARNIQGILLPPLSNTSAPITAFDWSAYCVVRFGSAVPEPPAHFVSSSQAANTMLAFDRIQQLGYQRIGFVCEYWRRRFFGSGYVWAQKSLPPNRQLPLLALNPEDSFETQQREFSRWLEQNQPDAILTDNSETREMLHNLGFRVPDDIGLATTSIHDTQIDAGIDQRPYEIGRAAVRMLTALIADKSFGLPDCRNEILIEGRWLDGTMLPRQ